MDVSVLQHANDKHPRQVAVEEVVAMIRGDAWPPGYAPLLVAGAVVEGGLQRKHVRWLTGLSAVHITGHGDGQPPWAADPHVVLSWADGSGGRYVVFLYEVSEGFRTDQQMRYYGRAFQWGCNYFERLLGAAADRILALSVTVQVRGGYDEQMFFYSCLKKWLVAMVAGWVDQQEVNQAILVLLALITGHHDLNPHRDCPCFDAVSEYIELEPKP